MLYYKLKVARTKLFLAKLVKEAQKLACAVVFGQLVLVSLYALALHYGAYTWFQPKTVEVYVSKPVEDSGVKIEAKEDTVENVSDISKVADLIWLKESTRGKNNYSKCEEVGKVNGIGYGINGSGKYMCFDSHEEEMKVLEGWVVSKRATGLSDDQLMCLYNTGKASDNCEYIR